MELKEMKGGRNWEKKSALGLMRKEVNGIKSGENKFENRRKTSVLDAEGQVSWPMVKLELMSIIYCLAMNWGCE